MAVSTWGESPRRLCTDAERRRDGRPPPAGSPNYVIALDQDTAHAFWKLHVDFATPANSTFTGPTAIAAASYSLICNGGGSCITQPTGGAQLASLGDRAMNRFVYRRFADHESLLLTHTVTASTGSGIRWYEIRSPATTPTVFQQGTYAPDSAFRWIPSIAMDASGDIAVVYSVSSSTIKPSVRIAAHAVTDPAGMFGAAESPVVDGTGVQTSIDRWGDYAALNIDPVDDCTFWATEEYHGANGQGNWRTHVASRAPDAGNGNDGNGSQSGGCCESSKGSSPYGSIAIAGLVLGIGLRRRRRA